ncbi:MAG: glycoside hydrolase family 127 protein [Planctomycetes bacterium]|nr:glycoside hydrolase family 127 protein [Planctomycetota bacterium]
MKLAPLLIGLAAATGIARAAAVSGAESDAVIPAYIQPFGLQETRWTEGHWARHQELCFTRTIPSVRGVIDKPGSKAAFTNFKLIAGLSQEAKGDCRWGDGDVYKYLEALSYALAATSDAAIDRELDERIAVIAKAQQANGYLHTVNQLAPSSFPLAIRFNHEDYNFGHLFTAAAVHHAVTGKTNLLAVARRAADLLFAEFHDQPASAANFGWNPSHMMGLIDLYNATGDRRYLGLCRTFVDARGTRPVPRFPTAVEPHPGDQNQLRRPLRKETEAVGHAVTATYLYCGAADLARETGDRELLSALARVMDDILGSKLYITGGVAAYHRGHSPRGDDVHEALANAYDLPLAHAYNETCSSFGFAMFCRRLLEATGDARYADWMEQTLFNACLAAVSLDGERFFYANPLAWHGPEQKLLSNDARERWTDWNCYCCPPQVARVFGQLHRWVYGTRGDDVWVHLYGGSTLRADLPGRGRVELEQTTDYPWSGQVRFVWKTAPDGETAFRLRVPAWARGAEVTINGHRDSDAPQPGSYLALRRHWKPGDTVELSLPMKPRLIEANPLVESTVNQAAVMRGPIVYCLESPDLPPGTAVHEVRLPRDASLELVSLPSPLDRTPGLRGEVVVQSGLNLSRTAPLYGPASQHSARRETVTLIPYFAWNNRGEPHMRVWLPLAN